MHFLTERGLHRSTDQRGHRRGDLVSLRWWCHETHWISEEMGQEQGLLTPDDGGDVCSSIAKLGDMPQWSGRGRSTVAASMNFVFNELQFCARTGLRAQYLACVCETSVSASQMFLSISSPVVLILFLLSVPCLSSFCSASLSFPCVSLFPAYREKLCHTKDKQAKHCIIISGSGDVGGTPGDRGDDVFIHRQQVFDPRDMVSYDTKHDIRKDKYKGHCCGWHP